MPSDDPQENPEERANRIRSFYKEYFDDSKPEPAGGRNTPITLKTTARSTKTALSSTLAPVPSLSLSRTLRSLSPSLVVP